MRMAKTGPKINVEALPFETAQLRQKLSEFLDTPIPDAASGAQRPVGNFRWGVYAFYDYDGEPIYVGQTNEQLRTRIRRHLTNQRTDAVAMSVLDPFEVCEIEVWPLPQYQDTPSKDKDAKAFLNALEHRVYRQSIDQSKFKAVLNEKDPAEPEQPVSAPKSFRGSIISEEVMALRGHPDLRIARRSLIISRLAQVISERKVQGGLRRVLSVQGKRLAWLAEQRFSSLGGEATVAVEGKDEEGDA